MKFKLLFLNFALAGCSLFGIQSEESPKYKVIVKEGNFEIREYSSYIVAKTTVQGDYKNSSGDAFRILAGYIFGKNKSKQSISMTAPVEMKNESTSIAMTSPVEMQQNQNSFTMTFSMPSKYSLETLPEPLDKRIEFAVVPSKIVASHEYTWLLSKERNEKKQKELREWLKKFSEYTAEDNYSYAGYNPPWTIPFLRRNEVHIILNKK